MNDTRRKPPTALHYTLNKSDLSLIRQQAEQMKIPEIVDKMPEIMDTTNRRSWIPQTGDHGKNRL